MSKRRVSFNGDDDPIVRSTPVRDDVIGSGRRFRREKKRVTATVGLRGISSGTLGLLRRFRAVMVKALRFSSLSKKSSRKVTATAAGSLGSSRSCGGPVGVDSQRAEAIDDCIEFLKSSLQRTNSVSTVVSGK